MSNFLKGFIEVKFQVKGISETTVILAATCGLKKGPLAERLAQKPLRTVIELFDKIEEYARVEEDST